MASLLVAAAGAGIGAQFGYAALGWSIGSFLGNQLFGPGTPDVEGPRLNDLRVQSSAYGAPIPIIYGKARVSGNVIWAKPIRERKIEEDAGGKGGGSGTVTTYEYYGSFAVALCGNEIAGVRKIWADSKLIYDVGDTASLETIQASNRNADKITIYYGTETQEADSLIQVDKGVANTQAYRGLAYIVFDDLLLEKYGRRIPNITAEVITSGSTSTRKVFDLDIIDYVNFAPAAGATYWDDANGYAVFFAGQWDASYTSAPVKVYKLFSSGLIVDEGEFYSPVSVNTMVGGIGDQPAFVMSGRAYLHRDEVAVTIYDDGAISHFFKNPLSDGAVGTFLRDNTSSYVLRDGEIYFIVSSAWDVGPTYLLKGNMEAGRAGVLLGWDSAPTLTQINSSADDMSVKAHEIAVDDNFIYVINSDNTIDKFSLEGVYDSTINFTPSPSISYERTGAGDPQIRIEDDVIWIVCDQNLHKIDNGSYSYVGTLMADDPDAADSGTHVKDGIVHMARTDSSNDNTEGYFAYQIESLSAGTITLSSIVSDICDRAGLSDYDTSALTDTVEGYVIPRPTSARKAIEPLQQAFFFDAYEDGSTLKFVKRGGASVASIPEIDLGVSEYGSDSDLYIHTRQQDAELPSEIIVDYIDINRSYQVGSQRAQRIDAPVENVVKVNLPIVMSADYAKEIANVLLYNAWVEREKFSISLAGEYIDLNPTDVFTFTVGSDTRKARITKMTYGTRLDIEAVAEDVTVYSATATAGASEVTEQSVGLEGPTKLYLLDIPLLRNADNDEGMYVAGSGYFSAWTGATLFKSLDGGTSYSPVDDILTSSVMGKATTALADANHTTFDRTNSVTVSITSGSLSSSTESGVIQGANYALLGTEIIQFVTATDNGDGTYTLSTLLRGRRGTDWATGTHAIGENFCLLRENVLERIGAVVNTERYYKAASFGTLLDEASAQTKTNTGVSQKPFSVKYIAHTRDGSDNISLSWTRRSRYIGTPLWNLPVFEDSESYKIEVLSGSGGSVMATYTSTSESYTYTASQQTADGFTPGDTIYFNIYQVGAVDGYETEYEAA